MEKFSRTRHYGATVLLVVLFFSLGAYYGEGKRLEIEKVEGLTGKETAVETDVDLSPFWKVWNYNSKTNYRHRHRAGRQNHPS